MGMVKQVFLWEKTLNENPRTSKVVEVGPRPTTYLRRNLVVIKAQHETTLAS
jgi:hypothetical protein